MAYSDWRRWNEEVYRSKPWFWWVYISCLVVLMVVIAVADSVAVWIVVGVVIAVWAVFDVRRYRRWKAG